VRQHRLPSLSWNYLRVRGEYRKDVTTLEVGKELPPRARRISS